MEGRSILEVAKEYLEKGYSIIPIKEGDKKPLVKWQEYQSRKATLDEVASWYRSGSGSIGIVTGRISNLTVVDVDPRHGGDSSVEALGITGHTVCTGGGGRHWYYRYCLGLASNSAGSLPGVDVRSEGGYVLAPPSKTVGVYSFRDSVIPRNTDLQPVPETVIKALAKRSYEQSGIKQVPRSQNTAGAIGKRGLHLEHVHEGSRNNAAAATAGAIISYYQPTYNNGFMVLQLWNDVYVHPRLDRHELLATWDSIWKKHYGINSIKA